MTYDRGLYWKDIADKALDSDLADELADLLWITIAIANQSGIDLSKAFLQNISKKSDRDKTRHLNNPKLK